MSEFDAEAQRSTSAPAEDPDLVLINRLVAGDHEALRDLYDRHRGISYALALRITGDRAAADDVMQEAFLGAWRNAARFVPAQGTVRSWLLGVVRHRAIDVVRRQQRIGAATAALPDGGAENLAPVPDTWVEVARRYERDQIRAALASLPAAQREVIELAYFGGLTQVEIAVRTRAPLGTVKSRIRLALGGMRAALADDERAPGRDGELARAEARDV